MSKASKNYEKKLKDIIKGIVTATGGDIHKEANNAMDKLQERVENETCEFIKRLGDISDEEAFPINKGLYITILDKDYKRVSIAGLNTDRKEDVIEILETVLHNLKRDDVKINEERKEI